MNIKTFKADSIYYLNKLSYLIYEIKEKLIGSSLDEAEEKAVDIDSLSYNEFLDYFTSKIHSNINADLSLIRDYVFGPVDLEPKEQYAGAEIKVKTNDILEILSYIDNTLEGLTDFFGCPIDGDPVAREEISGYTEELYKIIWRFEVAIDYAKAIYNYLYVGGEDSCEKGSDEKESKPLKFDGYWAGNMYCPKPTQLLEKTTETELLRKEIEELKLREAKLLVDRDNIDFQLVEARKDFAHLMEEKQKAVKELHIKTDELTCLVLKQKGEIDRLQSEIADLKEKKEKPAKKEPLE